MNRLDPNNPEALSVAATPAGGLESLRQRVDAAYAEIPDIDDLQFKASPDEAVPVVEGRVIDEAKRQRIKEAEQRVLDALETMPRPDPAQFKDLLPG